MSPGNNDFDHGKKVTFCEVKYNCSRTNVTSQAASDFCKTGLARGSCANICCSKKNVIEHVQKMSLPHGLCVEFLRGGKHTGSIAPSEDEE